MKEQNRISIPEKVLDELIADDYRDDPVGHETKWGEGWTRETFREYFSEQGYF